MSHVPQAAREKAELAAQLLDMTAMERSAVAATLAAYDESDRLKVQVHTLKQLLSY
jgi:hypothetical protein